MKNDAAEFEQHIRSRKDEPPGLLYKYVTIDTAKRVLESGKLRFRSPRGYNDPFDSQWNPMWSVETPAAVELEIGIFERALRDPGSVPVDASPQHRAALDAERDRLGDPDGPEFESRLRALKRQLFESHKPQLGILAKFLDIASRMRVCCFCESDRCPLMWAHYGCEHTGVVLGFDTWALETAFRRPLERVMYLSAPPSLIDPEQWARAIVFGQPSPTLGGHDRQVALTKATVWEYEREWRFVWLAPRGTLGDSQDFAFPAKALRQVVFGCKSHAPEQQACAKLVETYPHAGLFEMVRRPGRFELAPIVFERAAE